MAMDVGKSGKGPQSSINVTPLVDIVLVLLIIFMVLTPTTLKHLTANVPQEDDSAEPQPTTNTSVVIEYTADRKLLINNTEIPPSTLATKLGDRLKNVRKKVVFFKAHDDAPYGEVVRLMDVARGAGAETLAVVTEKD